MSKKSKLAKKMAAAAKADALSSVSPAEAPVESAFVENQDPSVETQPSSRDVDLTGIVDEQNAQPEIAEEVVADFGSVDSSESNVEEPIQFDTADEVIPSEERSETGYQEAPAVHSEEAPVPKMAAVLEERAPEQNVISSRDASGVTLDHSTARSTRSTSMAISIEKYVSIASTFPSSGTTTRSFGGLVFTASEMLPTAESETKTAYNAGDVVKLDLEDVKDAFGEGSNEFKFANGYYGYLSPSGTFASRLSFAKVNTSTTVPVYETGVAYEVGQMVVQATAVYKCKTAVAADDNTGWSAVSSSFDAVSAYAAATAYSVGDFVTKDSAVYKCTEAVTVEGNTGWDDVKDSFAGVLFAEKAVSSLLRVENKTNMFGSYTFLDTSAHEFTLTDLVAVATHNTGLDTKFLFVVNRKRGDKTAAQVVAEETLFAAASGTVYVSGATDYSGYMPMAILGSTDYANGVVTVQMFKQFSGELPTVNGDSEYETFNAAHVNFYGRTQTNGTTIDFYQRGYNTDGTDTSVYCNEMWFKAECCIQLMDLLLGQERLPANTDGVALVESQVYSVCGIAKANGMFMAKDVPASTTRALLQLLIRKGATTDEANNVISDVETAGFSVWATLTNEGNEYVIHYYVIYGTADSVRLIKGDDILIK